MNKISYFSLAIAGLLMTALFSSYSTEKAGNTDPTADYRKLPQVVESPDLDRPFDFAGEPMPMDNFDVRERLDRELIINSYRHSTTILSIKNAAKYFPVIEPILAQNGLPDDIKYLAVAESELSNATSPAGAKGVWQFMPATAKHYGLEINREVDERYHLEKATEAACKYLLELKRKFGSWTLAAAAYNMGTPRLIDEMEAQKAQNYFDLNLNQETARYVFRIVALKQIIGNPREFGFYIDEKYLYEPLTDYYVLRVDGPVENLGDFALKYGVSYRMLKVYNPWLLTSRLTNPDRKEYQIKIPKKSIDLSD